LNWILISRTSIKGRLWSRILKDCFGQASSFSSKSEDFKPSFVTKPVVIEDKVWIRARAMILKGVRIGCGSIVAAGAGVVRDVPPYSIVAVNPAKVVKFLKENHAPGS
jgi:acetyltransferase-like isoleucine patch superfamily enzyme